MNFIKRITKSGVTLYVMPMPAANTVASCVLVNVGSRDEIMPHEAGIAHGFEHMFCQGTERFPDKKSLFESLEGVGGIRNAYTSNERTLFINKVPFEEFEKGVDLLSEQLQHSLILEDKINKEVKVILQEIKRKQDNPSASLYQFVYESLFKDHPLGHSNLGDEKSLLNFRREDFLNFMKRYYNSANFTFFVAGRIDVDEAVKMFDKYFVAEIPGKKNERVYQEPNLKPQKRFILNRPINQVQICLAAIITGATLKEKRCLGLFGSIMGRGSASPLYEEIRDKRGLCYEVSSSYDWLSDLGFFDIYMATDKEKHQDAIDSVFPIIESCKNKEALLERAKKIRLGSLAMGFENPWDIIFRAASDVVVIGKPYGYEEIKESIKDITIQDIEAVVDKYLKPEQFTTILVAPEDLKV